MSIDITKRQRIEKLKQSIHAWLNEQPEHRNPNAGGGKLLRLIRPVNRLRLDNMLDELGHLTNLFPEKLVNEKLLQAREDFLDAIKSNLIRRAIMSLYGVQNALNFALEYLQNQADGEQKIKVTHSKTKSKKQKSNKDAYVPFSKAIEFSNGILTRKILERAIKKGDPVKVRSEKPSKQRLNVHIQDVLALSNKLSSNSKSAARCRRTRKNGPSGHRGRSTRND